MTTAYIFSTILFVMATISICMGIHILSDDQRKSGNSKLVFLLCMFGAIWDIGFGLMGLQTEITYLKLFRGIGIFGGLSFITTMTVTIAAWLQLDDVDVKTAFSAEILMEIVALPFLINRNAVEFVKTAYGTYFIPEGMSARIAQPVFLILSTVIMVVIIWAGWKRAKMKWEKQVVYITIYGVVFYLVGNLIDIFRTIFQMKIFPISMFTQMITLLFIKHIVTHHGKHKMTLQNFSNYIYSVVSTPILICDNNGEIRLYNESAKKFFHSFGTQLTGKELKDLFKFEETDFKLLKESGKTPEEKLQHIDGMCFANKGLCNLELTSIFDEFSKKIGDIIVVNDITEKIRIIQELDESKEEAIRANKAKSSFLANMSHEIRTPMNAVVGISELLLRKELSEDVRADVHNIQNAGNGLLNIINDILDISKIESGKYEIVNEPYNLESLLLDVSNIILVRLKDKTVKFIIEADPNLPKTMVGDAIRIKQILINIIGNAVKFTKTGYIILEISWIQGENGKAFLVFHVKDSGIGIKEQDIGKLFGLFNQVDTKKNRNITGSGLGLAISKNLAVLMGGNITVDSVYGKGTTFTITLNQFIEEYIPIVHIMEKEKICVGILEKEEFIRESIQNILELNQISFIQGTTIEAFWEQPITHLFIRPVEQLEADRYLKEQNGDCKVLLLNGMFEPPVNSNNHTSMLLALASIQINYYFNGLAIPQTFECDSFDETAIQPMSYAKVLIVDDNHTNLIVAEGLMKPYQMQIDKAMDGQTAISMVKDKEYDLVFMDHMMPGMDGVETVKEIRSLAGERFKNLPIVALSANALSGAREMFEKSGFQGFLAKPMNLQELDHVLVKYLAVKRPPEMPIRVIKKSDKKTVLNFIKGVHTDIGMKYAGMDLDIYHTILKTYYPDMTERLVELEHIFAKKDLKLFATYAHAMKSASASVGAIEISELAKILEFAGKEENVSTIEEKLQEFINKFREVLQSIGEYLNKLKWEEKEQGIETLDYLDKIDSKLKERLYQAVDGMDSITAEEVLKEINQYTYNAEIAYYLEKIGQAINDYQYDTALTYLKLLH
ncbi:MAG: ATP-binding protein [Lachnospiraceae bacterium]|nr:ATP-binding protein [Lachnospiraceae bacterium]